MKIGQSFHCSAILIFQGNAIKDSDIRLQALITVLISHLNDPDKGVGSPLSRVLPHDIQIYPNDESGLQSLLKVGQRRETEFNWVQYPLSNVLYSSPFDKGKNEE